MTPIVVAVAASETHSFSKPRMSSVRLLAGLGVEGDAHCGATVRHLYQVSRDRTLPNLRQVHLIHGELLDELAARGFSVQPGSIGENLTTRGVDLLSLPRGAELAIGNHAVVRLTGLRSPCSKLDVYQAGLKSALLDRDAQGRPVRKAGVMGVVVTGGTVHVGDPIRITLPAEPHERLEPV